VGTLLLEQGGDDRHHVHVPTELLDDIGKRAFPGYSAIGRLRGMAEIRGVMTTVAALRGLPV
jgi:D-mannonate dehydratase